MRLTLLTPRTVRQRRDSGDVYDDRSSFAIVNRLLPVPSFTAELSGECELLNAAPRCLVITTSRLRIEQSAPSNATTDMLAPRNGGGLHAQWQPPTPSSSTLRVRLILDAVHQSTSLWWPGKANPRQLPGTIRTLDKADGPTEMRCDKITTGGGEATNNPEEAHCAMGVISRDGWALLDDTMTGRFDGDGEWDWAAAREPARLAAERAARKADSDSRCEHWARSGECERNHDFALDVPARVRSVGGAREGEGCGSGWSRTFRLVPLCCRPRLHVGAARSLVPLGLSANPAALCIRRLVLALVARGLVGGGEPPHRVGRARRAVRRADY